MTIIDDLKNEKEDMKNLMKAIVKIGDKLEQENRNVDEILKRVVKKFGNSGHIAVPSKYINREAVIKILKEKMEDKS